MNPNMTDLEGKSRKDFSSLTEQYKLPTLNSISSEQARDIAEHLGEEETMQTRGSAAVADHFLTDQTPEAISVKKETKTDSVIFSDFELPASEQDKSEPRTDKTEDKASAHGTFQRLANLFGQKKLPETMEELRQAGIAACDRGKFAKGAEMLEKALKMGANDLHSRLHLGLAYGKTGRLDDAITLLSATQAKHGSDAGVATLLGKSLLLNSQYKDAVEVLSVASARNRDRFNLHYLLGIAHAKLSQFDKAIEAWMVASTLRPSHRPTREFLNRALDAKMQHAA